MEDREFDEFIGTQLDLNPCVGQKKEGFDSFPHITNNLVLRCGRILFPQVRELRQLYLMTCEALHMAPIVLNSAMASHYPTPEESGPFGECPKCQKKTLAIKPLCLSCEKAEGGKYKTHWICTDKECGYDEVSELFMVQAYNHFGIPIPEGMKKQLGIKTETDDGEK